jgi:hypothetical protein
MQGRFAGNVSDALFYEGVGPEDVPFLVAEVTAK